MRKIVFSIVLLQIACNAFGAKIEYREKKATAVLYDGIQLSGEIVGGDADRLAAVIINQRPSEVNRLVVNSQGGSIDEAIRITTIVKSLYLKVSVAPKGMCASACFLIFLAGSGKHASAYMDSSLRDRLQKKLLPVLLPGLVGLHRPYQIQIAGLDNNQNQVMRNVSEYLRSELLSQRLIDLMMARPSNDIYWLTADDLEEIGDYPPAVEEYLIQKCNYDRRWAEKSGQANALKLQNQLMQKADCIGDVIHEAKRVGYEKLRQRTLRY